MVRWQNQEDGYATPSSTEDELEVLEYETPVKHLKKNVPLPKSDYPTGIKDYKRFHGSSLAACSKTSLTDESLWGWSDDGLGEPQDWTRYSFFRNLTPSPGFADDTILNRNKNKPQHISRNNSSFVKQGSEGDARSFYQPYTDTRSSSQQEKDLSLTKLRQPM